MRSLTLELGHWLLFNDSFLSILPPPLHPPPRHRVPAFVPRKFQAPECPSKLEPINIHLLMHSARAHRGMR